MRITSTLVTLLLLGGTSNADELAHTRDVIGTHAASARRTRIAGGATLAVAGVALGVGGYVMVDNAGNGFLSDIDRAYGYSMLTVGALGVIGGTLIMLRRGETERLRDGLTDEQDVRHVRTEIADQARQARRTRGVVRGIGATLVGLGGAGVITSIVGGDSIDRSTHNELMGAGIALGLWGAGMVAWSFVDSRWEDMHDELQASSSVQMSAGLVPVRGGAIAGLGGTF